MHGKVFVPCIAKCVDARIIPDIGAVAACVTQPKIIDMRRAALFEHKDQFVLGGIERAHASIGFVPDAEVFQFIKDGMARSEQLAHMPPVHTDIGNTAFFELGCGGLKARRQKRRERVLIHFSGGQRKLAVLLAAKAGDMAVDLHIVICWP